MLSTRERFVQDVVHDVHNGWIDCPYCEDTFYVRDGEVDHIQPKSRGGSNSPNNLVVVCASCNRKKYDMPLSVFLCRQLIAAEGVYMRLKKQNKTIPNDMLDLLGYES